MAQNMRRVSVWGVWDSAGDNREELANLSEGIAAIESIREVHDGDHAFVLFRVVMEPGAAFIGTDLLRVARGRAREIINVNSGDPRGLVE